LTQLRVGRERPLQLAVVVGWPDGVEITVEHIREVAFFQRQNLAGVADHVGVRLRRSHVGEAVVDIDHWAFRRRDEWGLDVSVAVPLGFSVTEPNAVDHPVSKERVIAETCDRVGTVAHIAAVEFRGNRAGHLEVGDRAFLSERRPVASEVKR
jgi:hypothetical protein